MFHAEFKLNPEALDPRLVFDLHTETVKLLENCWIQEIIKLKQNEIRIDNEKKDKNVS